MNYILAKKLFYVNLMRHIKSINGNYLTQRDAIYVGQSYAGFLTKLTIKEY